MFPFYRNFNNNHVSFDTPVIYGLPVINGPPIVNGHLGPGRVTFIPRPSHIPPGTIHGIHHGSGREFIHYPGQNGMPPAPADIRRHTRFEERDPPSTMPLPNTVAEPSCQRTSPIVPSGIFPSDVTSMLNGIFSQLVPPENKDVASNSSIRAPVELVSTPDGWDCLHCSYFNPSSKGVCEMCVSIRPIHLRQPVNKSESLEDTNDEPNYLTQDSRQLDPIQEDDDDLYWIQNTGVCEEDIDVWSCSQCTFKNNMFLEKCEICDFPKISL